MLPIHNPKQIDPALLTTEEYMKLVDPNKKDHPDGAYDSDVREMNNKDYDFHQKSFYPELVKRIRLAGINIEIRLHRNPVRYPKYDENDKILRIDGEIQYFTDDELRKLGKKSEEWMIAAFDGDVRIASVQDEWGCVLVMVASEYRGIGLGTIMQKIARTMEPGKPSGGFTSHGYAGFVRVHREFVRDALKDGKYSKLVRAGKMSLERVRTIIASAKVDAPRPKAMTQDYSSDNPATWSLHVGEYGDFVLYDRKLQALVDEGGERADFFMERMIKGAVNVRVHDFRKQGKAGVLTLFGGDTLKIRKFMMKVALSFCAEEGVPLLVDMDDDLKACDPAFAKLVGEPNDDSGFRRQHVELVGEGLPLRDFQKVERHFRKSFDRYGEFENRIIEMGYTKFRPHS